MEITIQSGTIPNLQSTGLPIPASPELRIVASQQFTAADGTLVQPGPNFYKAITCSYNSGTFVLSYPQFTIESTTDGTPNTVSYAFWLFTGSGTTAQPICVVSGLQFAIVPPDPATTSLASLEIVNNNSLTPLFNYDAAIQQAVSAYNSSVPIPNGTTTPSVLNRGSFRTQNTATTNITTFLNGYNGQPIYLFFGDSHTSVFGNHYAQNTWQQFAFDGTTWSAVAPTAGVSSFNGRTGVVAPVTGDYSASMVTNAADVTAANEFALSQTIDEDIHIGGVIVAGENTGGTTITNAQGKVLASALTTVQVAQGGTSRATLDAHKLLTGAGASPIVSIDPGTAGQILTSNGASADPSFQAAAGGSSVLPGWFNVKDYGASGATTGVVVSSVVTATSGSTSAGSTSVTVAAVTSFSIGDYIAITNAGPSSGEYQGRITNIVGSVFTISPPTKTTVASGTRVAHADASVRTNASGVTASSTSITLIDASTFENGQGIAIPGAGASGGWYIGTLSAKSGSTFTVSPAISTSVTNAWAMHDDTLAIRAARDAAMTTRTGVVFFPAGIYNMNATAEGAGSYKGQVIIPANDSGNTEWPTLTLKGFSGPSYTAGTIFGAAGVGAAPSQSGPILKSSTSGDAVIAGSNAAGTDFTVATLIVDGLIIRTYDNPQKMGINAGLIVAAAIYQSQIDTGIGNMNSSQPTATTSTGIVTPIIANGAFTVIRDTSVIGYYSGIEVSEHAAIDNVMLASTVHALDLKVSVDPFLVSKVTLFNNTYNVWVSGTSYGDILEMDIEHNANPPAPAWQVTVEDMHDPSNLTHGKYRWAAIRAGGAQDPFTKNGGINVLTQRLAFPAYEVLNVENNTQAAYVLSRNGAAKFQFGLDFNADNTNNFYLYDQGNSKVRLYITPAGIVSLGGDSLTNTGITVLADGKVGIGTATPDAVLSIGNDFDTVGEAYFSNNKYIRTATKRMIGYDGANVRLDRDAAGVLADSFINATGYVKASGFASAINATPKTATYTVTTSDGTILNDSTGGTFVENLPSVASTVAGRIFVLINIGSANQVTVTANGSDNIVDGTTSASTYALAGPARVTLQSDGVSKWYVTGK